VTEDIRPIPADFFADWKEREALSEAMIPLIGRLYREKNISLYMYGKSMFNRSVIELMKAHRFVRQIEKNELSEYETFPLITALSKMNLGPAHIDLGKLAVKYQESIEE
jgi:glyceraldehyde 3-phosphate dehydrogenase